MGTCAHCGNDYDRTFTITMHDGRSADYDSFQCAISDKAPRCDHCDCVIIGHGRETKNNVYYCCAHCADQAGAKLEG